MSIRSSYCRVEQISGMGKERRLRGKGWSSKKQQRTTPIGQRA
jgi:hypothetical protein